MTTPDTSTAVVLAGGEGEEITTRGNRLLVTAASPRVTVVDYTAPAGFPGPPLHIHPGFDEVFIVIEGTLTARVRERVLEVEPGGTAYVPGSIAHTFANEGPYPVRFLVVCAPGGFEDYFRAVAAGDEQALAEAAERFAYAPAPVE